MLCSWATRPGGEGGSYSPMERMVTFPKAPQLKAIRAAVLHFSSTKAGRAKAGKPTLARPDPNRASFFLLALTHSHTI